MKWRTAQEASEDTIIQQGANTAHMLEVYIRIVRCGGLQGSLVLGVTIVLSREKFPGTRQLISPGVQLNTGGEPPNSMCGVTFRVSHLVSIVAFPKREERISFENKLKQHFGILSLASQAVCVIHVEFFREVENFKL